MELIKHNLTDGLLFPLETFSVEIPVPLTCFPSFHQFRVFPYHVCTAIMNFSGRERMDLE